MKDHGFECVICGYKAKSIEEVEEHVADEAYKEYESTQNKKSWLM